MYKSLKKSQKRIRKRTRKRESYIVIGSNKCFYCKKAIGLLKFKNKKYKYYKIEKDGLKIKKKYENLIPQEFKKFIPVIIKNKKRYIAGYNGLLEEFNN